MNMRDTIEYWLRRAAPFLVAVLFIAVVIALLLLTPARSAAALLGILAGGALAYSLATRARYPVQIGVLWSAVAVTADAAYARLNDQASVTLANALAKIIDAILKLAEPLVRALGFTVADPRVKVGAVAPEFVWALILSLIAAMAIGAAFISSKRR
jgi:hypothetical protein